MSYTLEEFANLDIDALYPEEPCDDEEHSDEISKLIEEHPIGGAGSEMINLFALLWVLSILVAITIAPLLSPFASGCLVVAFVLVFATLVVTGAPSKWSMFR